MGSGRFRDDDYVTLSTTSIVGKKRDDVFVSRRLHHDLDPRNIKIRESRDSVDNPESTPIIIGLDVTGSMGMVAEAMARKGLPVLAREIYSRKPVPDPHILCCGVGDVEYDGAPFQATQFEADIRIAEQMLLLYLECGGGGNGHESYLLPWYFAAFHTASDSVEKRGRRGYLFVSGDEGPEMKLSASEVERVFGYRPSQDYTFEDLYNLASQKFDIFHVLVEEGDYYLHFPVKTKEAWTQLMPPGRVLTLADHTKMAELLVSTMQVNEGADLQATADSWGDPHTSAMICKALKDFVAAPIPAPAVIPAVPLVGSDGLFDLTPGK